MKEVDGGRCLLQAARHHLSARWSQLYVHTRCRILSLPPLVRFDMDQHARQRSRGIRTIGKLSSSIEDDILLAQWPQPGRPGLSQQDVAVASEWVPRASAMPSRNFREQADPVSLFDAYERHQRCAIDRLLEAISSELSDTAPSPLVFEAPSTSQHDLLRIIRGAESRRELSTPLALELERRVIAAGETVARLWGLIELHRGGMIGKTELETRATHIKRDHDARPPLVPDL